MADTPETVAEAVADVAEAAQAEVAEAAEAAIEAAEEREEAAEELAEQLADSARNSEIMRQVAAFEQEVRTWQNETARRFEDMQSAINRLEMEMAELKAKPETPVVTLTPAPTPEAPLSIPPVSEPTPEATATLVTPVAVASAENTAPAKPEKRKPRFV